MRLGIDASNLRAGGGITHLVELLKAADPAMQGFSKVIVWSGSATLFRIEDRPWLVKSHQSLLDKNLLCRTFWQRFKLSSLARREKCDVLFVPGGSYAGDFTPAVTMSRNMLPFEGREQRRFGFSWMTLKLMLLRRAQADSFRRVDGLIFLTQYAHDVIMGQIGRIKAKTVIVPHGIDPRFLAAPRQQYPIGRYTPEQPLRLLYVSIIDVYKHQDAVVEAVGLLRQKGIPVVLELAGPAYAPALKKLQRVLRRVDPAGAFVRYLGPVSYAGLPACYARADICLFASSCENMPNILLEAMASGVPVACSDRGPMPEILGEGGVYFDPENVADIARALQTLIDAPQLRAEKAQASFGRAQVFSWERCARETFGFLKGAAVKTA
jgi:glycosyltransferase involved in cell wall biosynthesis